MGAGHDPLTAAPSDGEESPRERRRQWITAKLPLIVSVAILVLTFITNRQNAETVQISQEDHLISQERLRVTQSDLELSRSKQSNERLDTALEALSSDSSAVRLAGIYKLERIRREPRIDQDVQSVINEALFDAAFTHAHYCKHGKDRFGHQWHILNLSEQGKDFLTAFNYLVGPKDDGLSSSDPDIPGLIMWFDRNCSRSNEAPPAFA